MSVKTNFQESIMTTAHLANTDVPRSSTAVRAMLRDIGYVLWLSRIVAKEIQQQKCQPLPPEMSDYCAFEATAFAA